MATMSDERLGRIYEPQALIEALQIAINDHISQRTYQSLESVNGGPDNSPVSLR